MNRRRLAIKKVEVRRMPGFNLQGFTVDDLPEGVSVIHGPNASGKTTLAQAIRAALWPTHAPRDAAVELSLTLDEQPWTAQLEGGRTRWLQHARESSPPGLPGQEASDRYILFLHELLAAEQGDDRFAQAVLQESTGGYRVMDAANRLAFREQPPRRHNDAKKVNQTAQDKHSALAQQKEILQQERQLRQLQADHTSARQAAHRAELIELAIEHAAAAEELEQAQDDLKRFPEVLQYARGGETERLQEIQRALEDQEELEHRADDAILDATKRIDETALGEGGVQPSTLAILKKGVTELREAERDVQEQEASLSEHRERLENARDSLGEAIREDVLKNLDNKRFDEIAQFAQLWEKTQAELTQLDVEADRLQGEAAPDVEPLRRGIDALRGWMRESGESADTQATRTPLIAAGAIGGATLGAAALLVHLIFLIPMILVLSATLWGLLRAPLAEGVDRRISLQEAYRETQLGPPDHWEKDSVRRRLLALETEYVKALALQERRARAQQIEKDRTRLEKKKQELDTKRRQIEATIGPAPGDDPRTLLWVVQRALAWREAHDRLQAAGARRDARRRDRDNLFDKLNRPLAAFGYPEATDADDVESQVQDLEGRATRVREAKNEQEHAKKDRRRAREQQKRLLEQRKALYARFLLDDDEASILENLLARHEDYEQSRQTAEAARVRQETALRRLQRHALFDETLQHAKTPDLQQRLHAAQEEAEQAQDLHKRIVEIEKSVHDAKTDTRVQEAQRAHDEAVQTLRDAFEQDAGDLVGHLLARFVHEESRDRDRPRVFHRARELLLEFTRGHYQLEFYDQQQPAFCALDTQTQTTHTLASLSAGTRMQLLLAIRIAFVEQMEADIAVPVILDETLANSDDLRAGAIIDSVIALARTGRQVFYLTAQGDEVAKWKARLEKADDVEHKIVDLAEARALSQRLEVPPVTNLGATGTKIPGPNGASHDSYAQLLEVPPFDPRRDKGAMHLWYLIEDVHVLHRLLAEGVTTYGQLQALRKAGVPIAGQSDEGQLRCAEALSDAADAFANAWRVGRGKKVDRGVLEDSGSVSEKFIDALAGIAQECGGEAEKILNAIDAKQVPGFRANKRDELQQYLEEGGYLDPNPSLTDDEIRLRVWSAVADELEQGIITKADIDRLLERAAQRATLRAHAET